MSRRGSKRNGDTNELVDALFPLAQKRVPGIDRNTFRARITTIAKRARMSGVGEFTDFLYKPVQTKTSSEPETKMAVMEGRKVKITFLE